MRSEIAAHTGKLNKCPIFFWDSCVHVRVLVGPSGKTGKQGERSFVPLLRKGIFKPLVTCSVLWSILTLRAHSHWITWKTKSFLTWWECIHYTWKTKAFRANNEVMHCISQVPSFHFWNFHAFLFCSETNWCFGLEAFNSLPIAYWTPEKATIVFWEPLSVPLCPMFSKVLQEGLLPRCTLSCGL